MLHLRRPHVSSAVLHQQFVNSFRALGFFDSFVVDPYLFVGFQIQARTISGLIGLPGPGRPGNQEHADTQFHAAEELRRALR